MRRCVAEAYHASLQRMSAQCEEKRWSQLYWPLWALPLVAGCVSDKLLADLVRDHADAASESDAPARLVIPVPLMHCNPCNDFPSAPIIDNSNGSLVPANVA